MSARGGGREDRGRNPPSRHLWVGNLPHGISERELADRFIRFGEVESLAFQPGRSYAFLNFNHEEDAFAAIESLQGFPLDGNPLRIEFAKADKSSSGTRTEDIFRHDEQRRGSHFVQKESRMRYESPPKMSEASEVLYIGFPASMKVDDALLREVFSPFGEISKVTVFPGRSYAFVQFRHVIAACKAKENLEGKLFGNPRVHISFAKSEPSSGRGPSHSPPYRLEGYLEDRNYGSISRIPHYIAGERKGTSRSDGKLRSSHKLPHECPREDPHRFPSRSSVYEEEEDYYYQETKRLKTRSVPFPPTGQLRYMGIRNGEKSSLGGEAHEVPSLKDWNWEGTIAKGGNPICRAKCFPVGKVMDMMLPEFVDCRARTGLEMLAKHYYQSSKAWVVFFVPGSDADIALYNEFMHYLEEKQRAAVSKLDDTTTLFLVPPSDFSEKVLKVPGKLSIAGVILRSGPIPKDPHLLTYYGETEAFPETNLLTHRYSYSHSRGLDTTTTSSQPFTDQTGYHQTQTPGFQPHLASRQQKQVDYIPERYAPEVGPSFSHLQGGSNSQQEEETEANPQKRLQATLQLAAVLLQQIQQSKTS